MSPRPISSLLVANRGEIALRVMRTARALGLETVAVYSDADRNAPHVSFADKAICIGPAPVAESYLNADAILNAAKAAGADAIHPGYGFLSENTGFAAAISAAGLIFVGPPAQAIEVMGDKARAKRAMIAAGVPCIPGYEGEDQADGHFADAAGEIGFPVMVKAAAGGGGRGMRLVRKKSELKSALKLARSEAENAFGNGDLILEKAVIDARHVEIQVFADDHGTTLHLGERDCSVQRRHQKVLEEAPCPVMTPELRDAMGAAAVAAAEAVDYRGAGTVEFLLDGEGNFYFLEMNTRLQVEHPVTEMVTGLDLVALQIRVAEGAPLGFAQRDVSLTGHAIEARLYAEDPAEDFLPSTGPVRAWTPPKGTGIRVDSGIETGSDVSPFYDAMVAKIIAHGATRAEALQRLQAALSGTQLYGPHTNLAFLADAVAQPQFQSGAATTAFIDAVYGPDGFAAAAPCIEDLAAAGVVCHLAARETARQQTLGIPDELLDWSSTAPRPSVGVFAGAAGDVSVRICPEGGGAYVVTAGETALTVSVANQTETSIAMLINGAPRRYTYLWQSDGPLFLQSGATTFRLDNLATRLSTSDDAAGGGMVTAPMHGKLLSIMVAPGAEVKAGDRLAVLEAMKMQHEILAEIDGHVSEVHAAEGVQIAADDMILEITPTEEGADAAS